MYSRTTNLKSGQPDIESSDQEDVGKPEEVIEFHLNDIPLADSTFVPNGDLFHVGNYNELDRLDSAEHNAEFLDDSSQDDSVSFKSKTDQNQSAFGGDERDSVHSSVPEKQSTVSEKKRNNY